MINIWLLSITWIRRPQRVLRWLESFGRRKRRLLDMMARGPRTPEKWNIKEFFCLSEQSTRCDEAEHQAVVHEANPCFSFCDLENSSMSSSCASQSYFHNLSKLESEVNQLGNRFHICLYIPFRNWLKNRNRYWLRMFHAQQAVLVKGNIRDQILSKF